MNSLLAQKQKERDEVLNAIDVQLTTF
jgi:hypothetical protein